MLTTIFTFALGAFIFSLVFKIIFGVLGLVLKLVGKALLLPFLLIGGILFLPLIIFGLGIGLIVQFLPVILAGGAIYFVYKKFIDDSGKYWYK
ncbi:hypothetical protein [Anaerococcus sp. mt242]|nr:hypothetical protein [Anaerococcus sp. mt242]MBM0045673.1 hypothetical protein [Anaerococcus sp. mt242]